jgi:hypothetical protein
MSEIIDARKVLKQAQDAIKALQEYVKYLEQQLARQQNGSSGKIQDAQDKFMSWFKPTDEQIAQREAQRLEDQRQEDKANAYEEAEAAKKAARDKLEYDSRNHGPLYR